jgi:hypothetical protein
MKTIIRSISLMVIMQQPPEITVAYLFTEHLAGGPQLMEMVLERGNMFKALKRVRGNKGAPGIDNMTVDQLPGYLKRHWLKIRECLISRTAVVPIGMPGGVGGLLSNGGSYPDEFHPTRVN